MIIKDDAIMGFMGLYQIGSTCSNGVYRYRSGITGSVGFHGAMLLLVALLTMSASRFPRLRGKPARAAIELSSEEETTERGP